MFRTVDCGALRALDVSKEVVLSGWISKIRDKGFVLWIDLRDRYGITQLVLDEERTDSALLDKARDLGRECVIQAKGTVIERSSENPNLATGAVEVLVNELSGS
jgi:aspartyl-tRNA synthetase